MKYSRRKLIVLFGILFFNWNTLFSEKKLGVACRMEKFESDMFTSLSENYVLLTEIKIGENFSIYSCDNNGKTKLVGHIHHDETLFDGQLIKKGNELYSFDIKNEKMENKQKIFECKGEFDRLVFGERKVSDIIVLCNNTSQYSKKSTIISGHILNGIFKEKKNDRIIKQAVKKIIQNNFEIWIQTYDSLMNKSELVLYMDSKEIFPQLIKDSYLDKEAVYIIYNNDKLHIYEGEKRKILDVSVRGTFPKRIIGVFNGEVAVQYNNMDSYLITEKGLIHLGQVNRIIKLEGGYVYN
jgi:hypothetical protein